MEELLKKFHELAEEAGMNVYYESARDRYYFQESISSYLTCSYKKINNYLYVHFKNGSSPRNFPSKKLLEIFLSFWKEFGEEQKVSFVILEPSYTFMVNQEKENIRSTFLSHCFHPLKEMLTQEEQLFYKLPFGFVYEMKPNSLKTYLKKYDELLCFFWNFLKKDVTAHISINFSSLQLTGISYYYQGEENDMTLQEENEKVHLFFSLNEKSIEKEIFFAEIIHFFEQFFEKRKKARRIINHFDPPKRHFFHFINKIYKFNYFPFVAESMHQEFLTIFNGDYQRLEETLIELEKSKIESKVYNIIKDNIHVFYLFNRCFILSTKGVNETFHSYTSCSLDEAENIIQKTILSLTSKQIKKDIQTFKNTP